MIRVRCFYPADLTETPPPSASPWLPEPTYAAAHAEFLGIPGRLAQWLTLPLRLARTPPRVHKAVPADVRKGGGASNGWPLTVFTHGLGGTASTYSVVCSEIASHGAVVLAVEHKDGSAIYTHTADGHAVPFEVRSAEQQRASGGEEAWRMAQVGTRLDEVRAVLSDLAALFANTPLPPEHVDTTAVSLCGHSFGGATVLSSCDSRDGKLEARPAQASPSTVLSACDAQEQQQRRSACVPDGMGLRALVALDPWMLPVSAAAVAAVNVPTLAVLTQSLMFPANADKLRDALLACSCTAKQAALFIEAVDTRHQEMSDLAAISYRSLRATLMAGRLPPAEALRRTCDPTVGFLALHGALASDGSPELDAAVASVTGMLGRTTSSHADAACYLVHGAFDPSAIPAGGLAAKTTNDGSAAAELVVPRAPSTRTVLVAGGHA